MEEEEGREGLCHEAVLRGLLGGGVGLLSVDGQSCGALGLCVCTCVLLCTCVLVCVLPAPCRRM